MSEELEKFWEEEGKFLDTTSGKNTRDKLEILEENVALKKEITRMEEDHRRPSFKWAIFDAFCMSLAITAIIGILLLIAKNNSADKNYNQITNNIWIKDITKNDLISHTIYDDGLDGMTFEGKYQNKKSLVNISLEYETYTLVDNEPLYEVDMYAIATYKGNCGNYFVESEKITTIYTFNY